MGMRIYLFLLAGLTLCDVDVAATLSFADRVAARKAILEVYERHRDPSNPREVPTQLAEKQVLESLRLSRLLGERWELELTGDVLKRELDRILRNTQDPRRLGELLAAIELDPVLIQEVLVRPVLAERLARRSFERDPRTHDGMRWEEWWSTNAHDLSSDEIEIPAPLPVALPAGTPSCAIGEGWDNGILDGLEPTDRPGASLVWTGSDLLLWGGFEHDQVVGTGYRYDPVLELWSPISSVGAPQARYSHVAVWTGAEMIVWGGVDGDTGQYLETGARYDPASDSWAPITSDGAPQGRLTTAVWTGTEMAIWGGVIQGAPDQIFSDGARYDPQTDSWTPVPSPLFMEPRRRYSIVWSGSELIVWGGHDENGASLNSGGRYDPVTDSWSPTSTFHAPAARFGHVAVWADDRMILFGGVNDGGSNDLLSGSFYDPAADSWAPITLAPAPLLGGNSNRAVWTGTELAVVLSGGLATYSPATNTWSSLPCAMWGDLFWTGSRFLSRGTWGFPPNVNRTGLKFDPQTTACTPLVTPPDAPSHRAHHGVVWTGAELIVWGGWGNWGELDDGSRYDPALDAWFPVSSIGAPGSRWRHSAVWTGQEMIVWGGDDSNPTDTGWRYDPLTDTWTPTSMTGAPEKRMEHTALWTGSEMIVWGGKSNDGAGNSLGSGGRYDPASDTWTSMTTSGEPTPRHEHTAIWTGSEMIVWGGLQGASDQATPTGGRYDPVANSWSAMTFATAPTARFGHSAAWTGSEMIVWGGAPNLGTTLGDGSRYDPATDTWSPVSVVGAPTDRFWLPAVWTGSSMIVWGGLQLLDGEVFLPADGAIYDPADDSWIAMDDAAAPRSRFWHRAFWTGDAMILWGGTLYTNQLFVMTGGRYVYSPDDDGDGVGAACDCAPDDPELSFVPAEIEEVAVLGDKTTVAWAPDMSNPGVDVSYQVLRGQTDALPLGGSESCVAPGTSSTSFVDTALPTSGAAFFYLVRAVNTCGAGSYGGASSGQPRDSGACAPP